MKLELTAGRAQRFNEAGHFFRCMNSSGRFTVTFDGGKSITFERGIGYSIPGGCRNFVLRSETSQEVEFEITDGRVEDSRFNVAGNLNTKEATADTLATPGDVAVPAASFGVVIAANVLRREAIVKNPATNAGNFRVGGSSASATSGIELTPGESIVISNYRGEVAAFNNGASAESLQVMEITD